MSTNSNDSSVDRTLVHLVARRRPDHFELYLRSEVFEDYFRALAAGPQPGVAPATTTVGTQRYYNPPELPQVEGCSLTELDGVNLFKGGRTNVSHLRAVGLTQGVTIHIPTVLSNSQLSELTNRYYQAATRLYAEFIQPSEVELELVVRESVVREPVVTTM